MERWRTRRECRREVSPVAKRQDAAAQLKSGGVAVLRTVAPSFELGVFRSRESCEPVLTGERKLFRAPRRAHTSDAVGCPTLESVGYGSNAGYADTAGLFSHTRADLQACSYALTAASRDASRARSTGLLATDASRNGRAVPCAPAGTRRSRNRAG